MKTRTPYLALLLLMLIFASAGAQDGSLGIRLNKRDVPVLEFSSDHVPRGESVWRVTLLRSTSRLKSGPQRPGLPIARFPMRPKQLSFVDREAPEGVPLYYVIETATSSGKKFYSNVVAVTCPIYSVEYLEDPYVLVDKLHYAFLVYDGDTLMRSLPIALGRKARNRKLHFDRASTPEGIYKVYQRQSPATFYKAWDINYPNLCDKTRLEFFEAANLIGSPAPDIGGEIQVHGHGIYRNWTWGCIAMLDRDMDWLFSVPEFRVGLRVYIAGSEITPSELKYLRNLPRSEKKFYRKRLEQMGYELGKGEDDFVWALCQFQLDHNLVVSGLLDGATLKKLGPYRPSL